MFGFAWTEIALIVIIALVLIGPKDLPHAIRAVVKLIRKLRGMASEFQAHVDDLVRETDFTDMRQELAALRGLDIRHQIARAIDPTAPMSGSSATPIDLLPVPERPAIVTAAGPSIVPPPDHLRPHPDRAPSFVPPAIVAAERHYQAAPNFIPPRVAAQV